MLFSIELQQKLLHAIMQKKKSNKIRHKVL